MNSALPAQLLDEANSSAPPLTIALLGYRSHPFVGGQGIYLRYLSRALGALGHTVHVYSGPPYPELDPNITLIKIPSLDLFEEDDHIRALRWHHLRSFSDTYEWWTMLTGGFAEPYTFGRRLEKAIKPINYDIIHDNQSLCYALLNLQKKGNTVISTIHHPIHRDRDLALAESSDWFMRLLIRRWHSFLGMQEQVARKLNYCITVSEQSQKDIQKYFFRHPKNTPVFFNGVDTATFSPDKKIIEAPYSVLTTSSSDQPLKGLRHLILAISQLREQYPKITLTIIGKLKANGENSKLINSTKLGDIVHCLSDLSTDQLVKAYNQHSVIVCPSLYEGFGLPVAEAMSCGRPVISSDGGALPEVLGDAGIVVKAGDHNEIAKAIDSLWQNALLNKTLKDRARHRARSVFCWERVARNMVEFYHSCRRTHKTCGND